MIRISKKTYVCVKSVPDTDNVQFDATTGVMIRNVTASRINPFDLIAVETALQFSEKTGGIVSAVSMGPESSCEGLRVALTMGVTKACLLTSEKFSGSDVLATSYILSSFIKYQGDYNLIVCGHHSADGSTGQVGPEIAEFLNIPHLGSVQEIIDMDDNHIVVRQRFGQVEMVVKSILPCLIIPRVNSLTARVPSIINTIHAKRTPVEKFDFEDIVCLDPSLCGIEGSPTKVLNIFFHKISKKTKWYDLEHLQELAEQLLNL